MNSLEPMRMKIMGLEKESMKNYFVRKGLHLIMIVNHLSQLAAS